MANWWHKLTLPKWTLPYCLKFSCVISSKWTWTCSEFLSLLVCLFRNTWTLISALSTCWRSSGSSTGVSGGELFPAHVFAVESFAARSLAFKASILPTVLSSYNWSWSWSRELIALNVSPSAWCQNYLSIQDHRRLCRLQLPKPSVMVAGGFTLYKQLKTRTDFWRSWFQIKWVMTDVSGSRCAASFWTFPILSVSSALQRRPAGCCLRHMARLPGHWGCDFS